MLEPVFGPPRCEIHGRILERDSVPVRYGLIKFRQEYREAQRTQFPHAKPFALGGCRLGPPVKQDVMYCSDCRAAELRWHQENPDFDVPANVVIEIQTARRSLADSVAKRLLRQSQLDRPERAGRFLWIVYRLNLEESVAFDAEKKVYLYPCNDETVTSYPNIKALADALNDRYARK